MSSDEDYEDEVPPPPPSPSSPEIARIRTPEPDLLKRKSLAGALIDERPERVTVHTHAFVVGMFEGGSLCQANPFADTDRVVRARFDAKRNQTLQSLKECACEYWGMNPLFCEFRAAAFIDGDFPGSVLAGDANVTEILASLKTEKPEKVLLLSLKTHMPAEAFQVACTGDISRLGANLPKSTMGDLRRIFSYYSFHGDANRIDGIALHQLTRMFDDCLLLGRSFSVKAKTYAAELVSTAYARFSRNASTLDFDGFLSVLLYVSHRLNPELDEAGCFLWILNERILSRAMRWARPDVHLLTLTRLLSKSIGLKLVLGSFLGPLHSIFHFYTPLDLADKMEWRHARAFLRDTRLLDAPFQRPQTGPNPERIARIFLLCCGPWAGIQTGLTSSALRNFIVGKEEARKPTKGAPHDDERNIDEISTGQLSDASSDNAKMGEEKNYTHSPSRVEDPTIRSVGDLPIGDHGCMMSFDGFLEFLAFLSVELFASSKRETEPANCVKALFQHIHANTYNGTDVAGAPTRKRRRQLEAYRDFSQDYIMMWHSDSNPENYQDSSEMHPMLKSIVKEYFSKKRSDERRNMPPRNLFEKAQRALERDFSATFLVNDDDSETVSERTSVDDQTGEDFTEFLECLDAANMGMQKTACELKEEEGLITGYSPLEMMVRIAHARHLDAWGYHMLRIVYAVFERCANMQSLAPCWLTMDGSPESGARGNFLRRVRILALCREVTLGALEKFSASVEELLEIAKLASIEGDDSGDAQGTFESFEAIFAFVSKHRATCYRTLARLHHLVICFLSRNPACRRVESLGDGDAKNSCITFAEEGETLLVFFEEPALWRCRVESDGGRSTFRSAQTPSLLALDGSTVLWQNGVAVNTWFSLNNFDIREKDADLSAMLPHFVCLKGEWNVDGARPGPSSYISCAEHAEKMSVNSIRIYDSLIDSFVSGGSIAKPGTRGGKALDGDTSTPKLAGRQRLIGCILQDMALSAFEAAFARCLLITLCNAMSDDDGGAPEHLERSQGSMRMVYDRLAEALAHSRQAREGKMDEDTFAPLESFLWTWNFILEPISAVAWFCRSALVSNGSNAEAKQEALKAMISKGANILARDVHAEYSMDGVWTKESAERFAEAAGMRDKMPVLDVVCWLSSSVLRDPAGTKRWIERLGKCEILEQSKWRASRELKSVAQSSVFERAQVRNMIMILSMESDAADEKENEVDANVAESTPMLELAEQTWRPKVDTDAAYVASSPRGTEFRTRMRRLSSHEFDSGMQAEVECRERRLADYFLQVTHGSALYQRPRKALQKRSSEEHLEALSTSLKFKPQMQSVWPEAIKDNPLPPEIPSFCFPCGVQPYLTPSADPRPPPRPACFDIILTNAHNVKLFGTCLVAYEPISPSDLVSKLIASGCPREDVPPDLCSADYFVYLPKCICVISRWPFFSSFKSFLSQIYSMCSERMLHLPIERYIAAFMNDCPVPPRGLCQVQIALGDYEPIYIHRPSRTQLPLTDFSFSILSRHLGAENTVIVLQCLLHESRVVFCCSDLYALTPVCEALRKLLFPLEWQGIYIPILPDALRDFCSAPVPFIVGLHSSCLSAWDAQSFVSQGVVVVNLDKDTVTLPEGALLAVIPSQMQIDLVEKLQRAAWGAVTPSIASATPPYTPKRESSPNNTKTPSSAEKRQKSRRSSRSWMKRIRRSLAKKKRSKLKKRDMGDLDEQGAPADTLAPLSPSAFSNDSFALTDDNLTPMHQRSMESRREHSQTSAESRERTSVNHRSANVDVASAGSIRGAFMDFFADLLGDVFYYSARINENEAASFDKSSFCSDHPLIAGISSVIFGSQMFSVFLETHSVVYNNDDDSDDAHAAAIFRDWVQSKQASTASPTASNFLRNVNTSTSYYSGPNMSRLQRGTVSRTVFVPAPSDTLAPSVFNRGNKWCYDGIPMIHPRLFDPLREKAHLLPIPFENIDEKVESDNEEEEVVASVSLLESVALIMERRKRFEQNAQREKERSSSPGINNSANYHHRHDRATEEDE